ncbi:MAG TPA: hydrogenase small subunit [Methanosarcina thermophila]|jgi:F420-nonreducing hydrogenase I|uniref:Methanophenazine hydrogenase small subunit n=3 Tax=Methanosarcina thermophila TaxID=2210 RepID=A0A0E3NHM3_METTE|nr:hydrogenase small subunit [Methanosarcina thermophila]AKB12877.1 Methanophenazine hydrogenase small subunit precursor [Methanosarcina thermophila TM-1]AKB16502.1 Methanophenazine hydrogenase small subunit precursor [Methanosarcina thermophila CHTI-55]HOQ65089.1 hydrogenase small subunit [Methanosarcina thermophila]HPT80381.1 hydrogenase small subunit [Methanosarcina thermophila]
MSTGMKNLVRTLDSVDFLKMDRRTFMKAVGLMGASAFLGTYKADIVKALELAETKLVWLHGSECTGCSESLLNAGNPDILQALQKLNVNLVFHETICAQQGIWNDGKLVNTPELNSELLLEETYKEGNYFLVVEGSIPNGPNGSGRYLVIGNKTFKETLGEAAKNAIAVIAVGACACWGGITSADSDVAKDTDYRGVAFAKTDKNKGMLQELGIDKPVINIPGCPAHPDWILLTLGAVILGKIKLDDIPKVVDEFGRPKVFYPPDHTVHENCPRRGYYDRGEFDVEVGGEKCLWKLGCKAPYSHADCGIRRWNGSVSMCTQAGGPCIACVEPGWPDIARPLYVEREDVGIAGTNIDTIAKGAVVGAAVVAGVHAVRRMKGE